jgi:hypothetical protein
MTDAFCALPAVSLVEQVKEKFDAQLPVAD